MFFATQQDATNAGRLTLYASFSQEACEGSPNARRITWFEYGVLVYQRVKNVRVCVVPPHYFGEQLVAYAPALAALAVHATMLARQRFAEPYCILYQTHSVRWKKLPTLLYYSRAVKVQTAEARGVSGR